LYTPQLVRQHYLWVQIAVERLAFSVMVQHPKPSLTFEAK
jgi:hypothetical protein